MRLTPVAPTGSGLLSSSSSCLSLEKRLNSAQNVGASTAARVLLEDAELCGVRVPKGTTVWVPFYPMFVDPALWDSPLDFRPDRFKEASSADPKYTPFSAGPRNCTRRSTLAASFSVTLSHDTRHTTHDTRHTTHDTRHTPVLRARRHWASDGDAGDGDRDCSPRAYLRLQPGRKLPRERGAGDHAEAHVRAPSFQLPPTAPYPSLTPCSLLL